MNGRKPPCLALRGTRRAHRQLTPGLLALLLLGASLGTPLQAARYPLPDDGDVVGERRWTRARPQDSLVSLARYHDVGYQAMLRANPDLDIWLPPPGSRIMLPTQHILPPGARRGLVLNLAEMRLYAYPAALAGEVLTFPVGIGREGWPTPVTETRIKGKTTAPSWYPPESIRREAAAKGIILPERVPPGPDNPLGGHALYLALPGYLLHGTNRPAGVGMRVSHGCIRLYPEDIAQLYPLVDAGIPVRILDARYKAGWQADRLLLEVHPPPYPATARQADLATTRSELLQVIVAAAPDQDAELDWDAIEQALERADGIPAVIGRRLKPPERRRGP